MVSLKPVVVAVGSARPDVAAIRYAAHEARRDSRPLLIVHVVPQVVLASLSPMALPLSAADFDAIGRDVLDEASQVAYSVLPESLVSTSLLLGQVIPALVELASDAHVLVLGDDRRSMIERITSGSVVPSVAAHATAPVICVPADWSENEDDSHRRRIVVGIKDCDAVPVELLRDAMALAREQRAVLELAHAWDIPGRYGDLVGSLLDHPTWRAMVDSHLQTAVDAVRAEFPDVTVETSAWLGQPAKVLSERSADADLLVLTRKAHAFPFGHFGATGRSLLRDSVCPVVVLPVAETSPTEVTVAAEPVAR